MSGDAHVEHGADSTLVGAVCASPNHGPRLGSGVPDCLILHYTGMADGASAIRWLCDPVSGVSCHYVVEEDGHVLQLVPERRRAWHAGRSSWHGETDLNSASIGVEIVNAGHAGGLPPYPDAQIEAVIALCRDIIGRHDIPARRVLAHSDIAPARKEDPGERFPWERLSAEGVGLWVPTSAGRRDDILLAEPQEGGEVAALQRDLAAFGYGIAVSGTFDAQTALVVVAFQRHFRPVRVDGQADGETRAILAALLRASAAA